MGWDAVGALSALASTIVVAVAAFAAILQIRHLRAANQLTAILRLYERFDTPEMVEARRFVSDDLPPQLADRATLWAIARGSLDPRVTLLTSFYSEIGSLVVDGFVDERFVNRLGPPIIRAWAVLEPLAYAIRRDRPEPVWAGFEFIAAQQEAYTRAMRLGRYPRWFQKQLIDRTKTYEPEPAAEPRKQAPV